MKKNTLTQMLALTLSVSLTFGALAAEPAGSNSPLLKTLVAKLAQLHALQEKRTTDGSATAAEMYRTNVLLNRAQYLAKEKTRAEFLSISEKLHTEALAAVDMRVKLGSPPSDGEIETICEAALTDLALE